MFKLPPVAAFAIRRRAGQGLCDGLPVPARIGARPLRQSRAHIYLCRCV